MAERRRERKGERADERRTTNDERRLTMMGNDMAMSFIA
jgi:hypothetical protein